MPTPAAGGRLRLDRLAGMLRREGLLLGTVAMFVVFWSAAAPDAVVPDSWLTLLGGREVAGHGLPHHDTLAVISHGRQWVDQQWLAQLAYWGTYRLAGLRGDILLTILLELAALSLAVVLARRRGGTALVTAAFAVVPFFYFWSVMRAQVFSHLLFVVLLALLAAESRRRTRRVWLVFPLLLVWANVHGAVLVGAGLTALLGVCELAGAVRKRTDGDAIARAAALLFLPWLTLIATPWGLDMIGYYRATFGNSLFRQFQSEWMPPVLLTLDGFAAYALAAAAVFLLARSAARLKAFEICTLVVTMLAALLAVRSAPWFAYSCLILLPATVRTRNGEAGVARVRALFGAAAAAIACVMLVTTAAGAETRLLRNWPSAAADSVARAMRADPHARVFASHDYADWLLFTHPELRGRVAFDGRWEILSSSQTRSVLEYLWEVGDTWERASNGYRLVVFDPTHQDRLAKTYERRGLRTLFRDRTLVVYDRGAAVTAIQRSR
jgi:hypothetical protein